MDKRQKGLIYKFDKDYLKSLRGEIDPENDDDMDLYSLSFDYEVDEALQLIKRQLLYPSVFNSADWAKECVYRLEKPGLYPTLISELLDTAVSLGLLEFEPVKARVESNFATHSETESLEWLEKQHLSLYDKKTEWPRALALNLPNTYAKSPAELFTRQVLSGSYPSPEVMLSVAKCFDLYLRAEGHLSLEEVFFGKPTKKAGTRARQAYADEELTVFHDSVSRERPFEPKAFNLRAFAERWLFNDFFYSRENASKEDAQLYADENIDRFIRRYNRWKKNNPEILDE